MGRNGRRRWTDAAAANGNGAAKARVRSALLTIARLLERQIAREHLVRLEFASTTRRSGKPETDRNDDMIRAALHA